jgi:small subunit ribosomal protein S1
MEEKQEPNLGVDAEPAAKQSVAQSMADFDFRMPTMRKLQVGEVIEARVVSIGASDVFLDVGGKSEASIDRKELADEHGAIAIKIGDKVQAFVVATEPSVVLSHGMARRHLDLQAIEDAHDLGIPIEGVVTGVNKGGLDVELNGRRAFCPVSQIELGFCQEPALYVGQKFLFRVTQCAEGGRNVVVSRRALLEEERQEQVAETEALLQEGAQFEGKVIRLEAFGAFVEFGGLQGMVHISEVSHARIEHPSEVLAVGQSVRVQVLKIERDPKRPDRQRIGLSMRSLEQDPWDATVSRLAVGSKVRGKVVRLKPFGAFVEIAPGVDGLVHISELSDRRVSDPKEVVAVGDEVEATVLKVEPAAKRISLSLLGQQTAQAESFSVGTEVEAVVDRVMPFGLFVKIKGAARGTKAMIPAEETGVGRNANLRRAFPEGHALKAVVTAVDPDTGRLTLSVKAMDEMSEHAAYADYVGQEPSLQQGAGRGAEGAERKESSGMGSFGALLLKSFDKKKPG